jgi:hypothetical protein
MRILLLGGTRAQPCEPAFENRGGTHAETPLARLSGAAALHTVTPSTESQAKGA